jgi:hypothetical protein
VTWLKRFWPALFAIGFLIAVVDGTISSLATCHPVSEQPSQSAANQKAPEECSALKGPILTTLVWTGDIAHKFEGLITAIFTVVLAGFTAALWRSTDKLWDAGERQLKTTRSVAAVQARNTKRQLQLAEMTAERQLRAYVYIKEFRCVKIGHTVSGPEYVALKVIPVWKNSGQTPTRNMKNHISWMFSTVRFRDEIDFVDLDELRKLDMSGRRTYPLAIAPGESVDAEELLIWKYDVERMGFVDGKITGWIYIWGWAEYNDVFDNTPIRRTEFCVSVEIAATDLKVGDFKAADVSFCAVGTRNRADEECSNQNYEYPSRSRQHDALPHVAHPLSEIGADLRLRKRGLVAFAP